MLFISRSRPALSMVGAAVVVDHASGGDAGLGVAFVVGELQVANDRAVTIGASSLAQVHLPTDYLNTDAQSCKSCAYRIGPVCLRRGPI